jgi:hypothetical protein
MTFLLTAFLVDVFPFSDKQLLLSTVQRIEARIKYDVASACIGKIGISFQKYSFQPEEECVKKILML